MSLIRYLTILILFINEIQNCNALDLGFNRNKRRSLSVEEEELYTLGERLGKTHQRPNSSSLVLAGNLSNILSKLFPTKEIIRKVIEALQRELFVLDFVPIGILCVLRPVTQYIYNKLNLFTTSFKESVLGKVTKILQQLSQILLVIYATDVIDIILTEMGFHFYKLNKIASQTLFAVYFAYQARKHKHNYLKKQKEDNSKFPYVFLNRGINTMIDFTTLYYILQVLEIKMGMALSSFFAFGGIGSVVFSLASQNIVAEIVSGIALVASQKFQMGDCVFIGDDASKTEESIKGYVWGIGIIDMQIRGFDSLVMRVGYSDIYRKRFVNVSRLSKAQVYQEIRFQYQDIKRIPQIIKLLEQALINNCPELILDGTRPFRITMYDFSADAIVVIMDTHHHVNPSVDKYYDVKQNVLDTVSRVLKQNEVYLSYPTWAYVSKKGQLI